MILKINGFQNEIVFEEDFINVLVIENINLFTHFIEVVNNKINGLEDKEVYLIDDNNEEINMNKNVFMITDLFNVEYNTKKILDKIYALISDNIRKNQDYEIERMTMDIRNYLIDEINELPFEFIIKDEIEVKDILKIYNLKIDNECYNSVLERVELIIDIISTLNISNLLIIPNLKNYLSDNEIVELYKYSMYNQVKLLLVERNSSFQLKYEKIYKIDRYFNED